MRNPASESGGMGEVSDVVVVGGGLAGLAAAAYVGRAGRRVTVIERASAVGGRATTQVKDGFAMNLGPHALYLAGAGYGVLRELGVETPGKLAPASGGFALRDGRLHTLPTGFVSLLTTGLFDLQARIEGARFLASIHRMDVAPLQRVSVRDWLARDLRSPAVRGVLEMLIRVSSYSADLERLSAGAALAQLQLVARASVRYIDGGWATLVAGLRRAATDAGATIHTGARAVEVLLDGGCVTGVRLADGTRVEARAVVLAVSPAAASALVPRSASLAASAAAAIPVKAACLDLALTSLPRPGALVAFGVDRPLYLSVHSAAARVAPQGSALVHLAKYLPSDGDGGDAEAELEALMEQVQPGFRDRVVDRRFLPGLVVSNALVTAEGGGAAARPRPEVRDVRGLLVAGDWVGDVGMLADAALGSARRAAEIIAQASEVGRAA